MVSALIFVWYLSCHGVWIVVMHQDSFWYLVQCKPREGFRAEAHLQNQHYECFHPTTLVKRKIAGQVRSVMASLFPYYLFVRLNDAQSWSTIRSTRGVSRLVHFNGIPARIDDALVDGLQYHCSNLQGLIPAPIHHIGDKVQIKDGIFSTLEAMVTAVDGDERVTLLLNFLNRPQYIDLSVHSVMSIA